MSFTRFSLPHFGTPGPFKPRMVGGYMPGAIPDAENDEIDQYKTSNPSSVLSSSAPPSAPAQEQPLTSTSSNPVGPLTSTGAGMGNPQVPQQPQQQQQSPQSRPDISSRLPDINLPDISTMHDSPRLAELQGHLDHMQQPMSMKGKLLRAITMAAPAAIGGVMGGGNAAGGAAAGTVAADQELHTRKQNSENQLLHEIQQAQQGRDVEYGAQVRGAEAKAGMQSNALWRDAMLGQREHAVDTRATTQTNIANDRNTTSLLKAGLGPDGKPLPDDQLPPGMRDALLHHQAQNELMQAQGELAKARAAGIPAQVQLAQQRLAIAQQNAATARGRLDLSGRQFEANYYGTDNGQPIPGMPTDDTGGVVGPRPYAATGPTGTTKTKVQQASAIEATSSDLTNYIKAHRNELGPIMGRTNNLEDFIGNVGPEGSKLRSMITSYAALHPALHGFRGQSALKGFEEAIGGMKKNPDAMIAAIEGLTNTATTAKKAWSAPSGYRPPAGRKPGPPTSPTPPGGRPPGW